MLHTTYHLEQMQRGVHNLNHVFANLIGKGSSTNLMDSQDLIS